MKKIAPKRIKEKCENTKPSKNLYFTRVSDFSKVF